jgi:hypothetical protein
MLETIQSMSLLTIAEIVGPILLANPRCSNCRGNRTFSTRTSPPAIANIMPAGVLAEQHRGMAEPGSARK